MHFVAVSQQPTSFYMQGAPIGYSIRPKCKVTDCFVAIYSKKFKALNCDASKKITQT